MQKENSLGGENVFIHSTADVQSKEIGQGGRVWQYVVILPLAKIGSNVNVCSHSFVENHVVIGNNVTIKNGVMIYDGVIIEDDVFIGPNVSFTNDPYPRSKKILSKFPVTTIKKGASLGAGCVILPGVTVGEFAIVGAGTVVTKDVPSNAVFRESSTFSTSILKEGGAG
jgi:acetyltransferase-like isoleucine patch superfamily enzyme